jgi:hypothetical protein
MHLSLLGRPPTQQPPMAPDRVGEAHGQALRGSPVPWSDRSAGCRREAAPASQRGVAAV